MVEKDLITVKMNTVMMRPGELKPYYLYRFLKWKMGNKSPLTAVAKITSRCNLRCKHCPWWKWEVEDKSTVEWKRTLSEVRKKGVIHLIIEGGEPTIRDDLNEIISHAKSLGMLVMVITNGTNDLSRFDPDNYWISIDGVGDTHDRIRGKGVFDRVVSNIKNNPHAPKIVLSTINKENADQIEEIASYFSPITDGVWFNFMYPYRSAEDIALSVEEQVKHAEVILKLKKNYKIINSDSYLKNVGKNWTCSSFLTLLIRPDTSMTQGCTVEQIEKCRCEECNMGCYGELSQAMKLKRDSIEFLKRSAGLVSKYGLWLKPEK